MDSTGAEAALTLISKISTWSLGTLFAGLLIAGYYEFWYYGKQVRTERAELIARHQREIDEWKARLAEKTRENEEWKSAFLRSMGHTDKTLELITSTSDKSKPAA